MAGLDLTTATYLAREGVETLVIEKAGLVGQAGITQTLDNFPDAELAAHLTHQAQKFGAEILQRRMDNISVYISLYLCQ